MESSDEGRPIDEMQTAAAYIKAHRIHDLFTVSPKHISGQMCYIVKKIVGLIILTPRILDINIISTSLQIQIEISVTRTHTSIEGSQRSLLHINIISGPTSHKIQIIIILTPR